MLTQRDVKVRLVDSISLRSRFFSMHEMSYTMWRMWFNSICIFSRFFD